MRPSTLFSLLLVPLARAAIIPRQDPGLQQYPSEAKAPNTFKVGHQYEPGQPPQTSETPPALYGARTVDLPFGRLFHGHMNFFRDGEDASTKPDDDAKQSACGIPDNAYANSKVAIHPYFLKYAGLDRYCMQDVCIAFWKEDGSSDMIAKVTDICSTDPNDPSHCETPEDIKLPRGKVGVMEHLSSAPGGDQYPEKTWWYFVKCWAESQAQPAYRPPINNDNWFTTPFYPNNLAWAQQTGTVQYKNNQAAYPSKGWDTYPNGFYTLKFHENYKPLTDWTKGQDPSYTPIAGGKGYGQPSNGGLSAQSTATTNVTGADACDNDGCQPQDEDCSTPKEDGTTDPTCVTQTQDNSEPASKSTEPVPEEKNTGTPQATATSKAADTSKSDAPSSMSPTSSPSAVSGGGEEEPAKGGQEVAESPQPEADTVQPKKAAANVASEDGTTKSDGALADQEDDDDCGIE